MNLSTRTLNFASKVETMEHTPGTFSFKVRASYFDHVPNNEKNSVSSIELKNAVLNSKTESNGDISFTLFGKEYFLINGSYRFEELQDGKRVTKLPDKSNIYGVFRNGSYTVSSHQLKYFLNNPDELESYLNYEYDVNHMFIVPNCERIYMSSYELPQHLEKITCDQNRYIHGKFVKVYNLYGFRVPFSYIPAIETALYLEIDNRHSGGDPVDRTNFYKEVVKLPFDIVLGVVQSVHDWFDDKAKVCYHREDNI